MQDAKPVAVDPDRTGSESPRHRAKPPRRWSRALVAVAILLVAAGAFAVAHVWSPHANLRITLGPPGSTAERFITAFVSVSRVQHPRVNLDLVRVDDLAGSAKALEERRTDLAIVRSDAGARSRRPRPGAG